ncbi:MAG: hypothetical protein R6U46_10700 [Marinilabilia sp.]
MTDPTNQDANADKALLEERLKNLDKRNFDWSSWKKGTRLVLEKVFGPDSLYVKELINTEYEYSSWSLRDTAGSEDPVKSSVRELLQICITDVANRQDTGAQSRPDVDKKTEGREILKQFLNENDFSELKKIAGSDNPAMIKEEKVSNLIKEKLPNHQEMMLGKILLWLLQE